MLNTNVEFFFSVLKEGTLLEDIMSEKQRNAFVRVGLSVLDDAFHMIKIPPYGF